MRPDDHADVLRQAGDRERGAARDAGGRRILAERRQARERRRRERRLAQRQVDQKRGQQQEDRREAGEPEPALGAHEREQQDRERGQ